MMHPVLENFQTRDIPCCWVSDHYYDEMMYTCALTSPGSTTILRFPMAQPGLVLTHYGFTIAVQIAGVFTEMTYDLLGFYSVSFLVNRGGIEGYVGKQFPISGYMQSLQVVAPAQYQTLTVLNPDWLCPIQILIREQDTALSVECMALKLLPDNSCFFARIRGKYL